MSGTALKDTSGAQQYATFQVGGRLFGIDVTTVQEIVKPMPMTRIPLSQKHVAGLINLRGQIATAIDLHQLFELGEKSGNEQMNVVCRTEGALLSFLVDEIGDVLEVSPADFERIPSTINGEVRRFLKGVYKVNSSILSAVDLDPISRFLGIGRNETNA